MCEDAPPCMDGLGCRRGCVRMHRWRICMSVSSQHTIYMHTKTRSEPDSPLYAAIFGQSSKSVPSLLEEWSARGGESDRGSISIWERLLEPHVARSPRPAVAVACRRRSVLLFKSHLPWNTFSSARSVAEVWSVFCCRHSVYAEWSGTVANQVQYSWRKTCQRRHQTIQCRNMWRERSLWLSFVITKFLVE